MCVTNIFLILFSSFVCLLQTAVYICMRVRVCVTFIYYILRF